MTDSGSAKKIGEPWPKPPPPPRSIFTLLEELLGCVFGNLEFYQGALHYWLMWRLPQIVELTRAAPGLKFHYCAATPRDLYRDFNRLFLLPDLLTIGQCGPLLMPEPLFFLHDFDKTWPNVDGKHNALAGIACKPDRPVPNEMLPFLRFYVAPLAHLERIVYVPLSTMLSGPTPESTPLEAAALHLEHVMKTARDDGLPFGGSSVKERTIEALEQFSKPNAPESLPMHRPDDPAPPDFTNMQRRDGRLVEPDALYPIVDSRWTSRDILAFEFYLSRCLDSMLLVGGEWADMLPVPGHHFDLQLPYIQDIPPDALAAAIGEDHRAFRKFRTSISTALSEAFSSLGSNEFDKKIRQIQHDVIDAGLTDLNQQWEDFKNTRLLRFGLYTTLAIPIEIGLYHSKSLAEVAALLTAWGAGSVITEILKRKGETNKLRDESMYFIWRIKDSAKRR